MVWGMHVAGRDDSWLLAHGALKQQEVSGITEFPNCFVIIFASFFSDGQPQKMIHWPSMLLEALSWTIQGQRLSRAEKRRLVQGPSSSWFGAWQPIHFVPPLGNKQHLPRNELQKR